jgi:molecular chaperone GrpE
METDSRLKSKDSDTATTMHNDMPDLVRRMNEAEERIQNLQRALHDAQKEQSHVQHRMTDDLEKAYKYAIENLARSLLSFKDNLETALHIETDDVEAFKQGLELSSKLLDSALQSHALLKQKN